MSENIAKVFVESAKLSPDKTAVVEAAGGRSISFREMDLRANNLVRFFTANGIRPGDRVMLMVGPSIDFICLSLALFKLGATIILIDPGMGYRNLLRCIESVAPEYLVGIPKALLFSRLFKRAFGSLKDRFCVGKGLGIMGKKVAVDTLGSPPESLVYEPEKNDLAAIIFTTGSTGPPKGVRYEHSIFFAQLELIKNHYRIGPADIDQPGFPLFALFATALGATAVIPDMDPTRPAKVNPRRFVDSINHYGVTYSFGSPAIWNVVSRYCIEKDIRLKSVNKVLMAGAPVPTELLQRMRRILPEGSRIHTPYGATECLPIVDIDDVEILEKTDSLGRSGKGACVGRPLPGIEVRIMKQVEGAVERMSPSLLLEDGKIGEIIVKGGVVTRAYQNNEEETARAKIADDGGTFWHRIGDLGYFDDERRLWFCGRKAHKVVTPYGEMYTIPCEAVINVHPEVSRSALVGVRRSDGFQEPVLIIEPVKAPRKMSDKELLRQIAELAADSVLTEKIEYFLLHRSFPVDIRHNAKIFREKLAVWAGRKLEGVIQ